MNKKPLVCLVIALIGATVGAILLKPDGPRKRLRAQHFHGVNSIYSVTGSVGTTNVTR